MTVSNKFRLAHMIYEILPCNSWEKTACCSCLKGKYKENKRDNRKKNSWGGRRHVISKRPWQRSARRSERSFYEDLPQDMGRMDYALSYILNREVFVTFCIYKHICSALLSRAFGKSLLGNTLLTQWITLPNLRGGPPIARAVLSDNVDYIFEIHKL